MFKFIKGAFHSTVFLIWMVVALATTTVSAGIWAVSATYQVAALTTQAAATVIAHRKALAKAVLRTKAKARLRRTMVAVPLVGIPLVAVFEELDYREWLEDNPDKGRGDYGCELATLTAEVLDEFLADLPERVRPSPETVVSWLPECEAEENRQPGALPAE